MYDVLTIGSATIDVFARTKSELVTIKTDKGEETLIAYPSGTKILITDLDFHTGGGGTNTSVSFSRLGLRTGFIGKLGRDSNAELILNELRKERVDFLGVRGSEQTGYSVVLDSIAEDRTILTFKGANSSLLFSELRKPLPQARWLYCSSMIERSYKALEKTAGYAKKSGIKVAFNPSSYMCRLGTGFMSAMLASVDLLILNKEEAEYLVGHNPEHELLRNLSVLGPKLVIITDGRRGAHAFDGRFHYFLPANKVRIRETTGAGDAFASGLVAGLLKKGSLEHGLHLGMANATSVIRHLGAKKIGRT